MAVALAILLVYRLVAELVDFFDEKPDSSGVDWRQRTGGK
jgi:hypothetical protein